MTLFYNTVRKRDANEMEQEMSAVFAGRYTAAGQDDVTVFLIGMRLNRPWRVDRWWPVLVAMPRMIRHLASTPDAGMLGFHSWVGRTTIMLSYWRSPEHLQRFAADADAPHLAPWRRYMKVIGSSGDVGVWHETYVSHAGEREMVYANMPAFGMAVATEHVKIGPGLNTAKQRISAATPRGRADTF